VNGEDFRCDVTDEWATEVLHQTPGKVRLTIYRDLTPFKLHEDNDVYEVFTIDLLKKPGKGLGFSITGRQHDNGIFISDVVRISFRMFDVNAYYISYIILICDYN
jgi:multiple PDZ domain protein